MGRQCSVCVDGYWDLSSGEGCKPCDCDPIGAYNRTCDDRTGQCYCKPGTTGKQCAECLPLHYGFSPKGCPACECDPIGSTASQCDDRGQCPCRPNVEGRRCERCRENKYNKEAGCLDCPPCYTLVQEAVNDHRTKLQELTQLLDEIERNPQVVEDMNFERQLQEVGGKVSRLLEDARRAQGSDGSLIAQLETLKDRIRRVQETAGRIAEQSEHIGSSAAYGTQNITLAEQIIDRANEALAQARRFLDSEGMSALEKAQQRSDRFGQQSARMSEIARESRTIADRHEGEATDIENTSREALNTSDTAFRLANDAIATQEANRAELKRITDQLEDTTDLLLRTEKMSEEANRGAAKAHDDALAMYTDVNAVVVPALPSDRYRMDAIDIIAQAKNLIRDVDDLLARHANTLNGTRYQLKDARDLLEEAMRQQRVTDELLANTDAALERAKAAVAGGERVLEDAKQTLKTLKEFDATVQESRGRADDALKKVPEIDRLITDAEAKTGDAEQALEGALTDAIEARDVAKEAQRIAEKASDDADRIRGEAGHTKTRAGKLKGVAEELAAEVDETSDRMKGYEDQAKSDGSLAEDALSKANQAKTSAQEAARKVADSARTVDGILNELGMCALRRGKWMCVWVALPLLKHSF
jgi:laminin gamma 1